MFHSRLGEILNHHTCCFWPLRGYAVDSGVNRNHPYMTAGRLSLSRTIWGHAPKR